MNIEIVESKVQQFPNLGRYFFATLNCGKHSASFAFSKGRVVVCVHNASNRVWRGLGKTFASTEAALANYSTPAIQALIREADRLNQAAEGFSAEMIKAHSITEVA